MSLPRDMFGRNLRLVLDPVFKNAGFRRKGNTTYWRVADNLLQFVSVEHPPGDFTVVASIQPLFVPSETFVIAFGDRLGRFVDGLDHWFPADTEHDLISGLYQACKEIQEFALPWFDELASVQDLTHWYRNGGSVGKGKHGTGLYGQFPIWMGYCHAYLGHTALAVELIDRNLDRAIRREWPLCQPTHVLLETLRHKPEQASDLLSAWSSETRGKLGLA